VSRASRGHAREPVPCSMTTDVDPAPAAPPTSSGPVVPLMVAIDGRGKRITLPPPDALGIRTPAEAQKLQQPWRARGKRATLDIGKLIDLDTSGALVAMQPS
jgi:hypothetical protein